MPAGQFRAPASAKLGSRPRIMPADYLFSRMLTLISWNDTGDSHGGSMDSWSNTWSLQFGLMLPLRRFLAHENEWKLWSQRKETKVRQDENR
jgi:hypothetical protein